jgi:hypothetical protein
MKEARRRILSERVEFVYFCNVIADEEQFSVGADSKVLYPERCARL